ncbi:hypothetical protein IV203_004185 [Nitzschia inconspicua]|uniref:Uncharacterized protein n=1 Tax=Nitzschia inconspicua TaxID=303405 RepID=A0A9K3L3A2_9STRA|nr:hypothetical protein IV203_004185 [Nitzschia inconspicua]
MLGGFNFLEHILEEIDDEMEETSDRDDFTHEQGYWDYRGVDHMEAGPQEELDFMCQSADSEAFTTSFESTENTRSLSDSCSQEDREIHKLSCARQEAVNDLIDDETQLQNACTAMEPDRHCRFSSNTHHLLDRMTQSHYHEVPEESRRTGTWFRSVKIKKSPSTSQRKSISDVLQFWKISSNTKRHKPRFTRGMEKTRSDDFIKTTLASIGKHRKTPSGSFADAIGREDLRS